MKVISVEEMRQADQQAIATGYGSSMMLMNRAGAAVARSVAHALGIRKSRRVVVVAGKGNNGGDACLAARALFVDGYSVQVIMTCVPTTLSGDARKAWDEMRTAGVPYLVLASPESWQEDLEVASCNMACNGVVVDGVLGTGFEGELRGAAKEAIKWINRMRSHMLVVAIDIPSGMDGNSGRVAEPTVKADMTITFARPKRCFLNSDSAAYVGHLLVADIGIPDSICDQTELSQPCEVIALPEIRTWLAPRVRHAHKGDFGRVCIIGGSQQLPYAPVLSALGALHGGAGLITLAVPEKSLPAIAAHVPEAMPTPIPLTPKGYLTTDALVTKFHDFADFDVVVAGPGLGSSIETQRVVTHLYENYPGKLLLDADALTALSEINRDKALTDLPRCTTILTPHPGEAATLLHTTSGQVQQNRIAAVQQIARTYQAIAVLKGAGTLVCKSGSLPWINLVGNPGMATGGSGDVLTGIIAALWCRGISAFQAATAGVWAHGTAGDYTAFERGEAALSARDLAVNLYQALYQIEK